MVILNIISEQYKNKTFLDICEKITAILPSPSFEQVMPVYEKYHTTHLNNFILEKLLNKNKFRDGFINKLLLLVEKIYGKKVEFNIVKLKKLHLNSDLYTQAVALKLKNRNNRLYKVLKSSLNKVQLPPFEIAAETYHYFNRNDLLVNIIRNDKITSMFKNNVQDSLNTLLLDTFTNAENIKTIKQKEGSPSKVRTTSLQKYIFKSLKHLSMRGIRIEAKGRASRRLTAARSVFKMK